MNTFEPWVKYPPLQHERLSEIASIIRKARRGALLLHDAAEGDNAWSLGCRMYVRTCHALKVAAARLDWLTIVPEAQALRFTFAIGSVPLRFYKGPADETPNRYLETTYAELNQQQMAFEFEGLPCLDRVVRIAVETDVSGDVSQVSLVELEEFGTITGLYRISLVKTVNKVKSLQARAVTLPAPTIKRKTGKSGNTDVAIQVAKEKNAV